eukprot:CAMPEP_0174275300 /NCGR_PEP_ID=MMETSP0439-20130205/59750_1 /TAXON_ID=0 /ORGANISM="Stereomyxa ramosa, Strain Chinc5" /LENGTH=349 /DNA_ID=CAMNT_0015367391 /DNA_START=282 /DNA_END=1331 /DNA_ORIENTATION=+
MPKAAVDAFLVRVRIEEITHQLTTGNIPGLADSDRRSPSPPPQYDPLTGKRTNTREQRIKQKLQLERQSLIQTATKVNPLFKPPADYRPISVKKTKKILIPVDKYPDYNFIGLIIGPRGDTHKQLERESGAKISIRGKGSQKDGQFGKNPGDDEELHVLVTADTDKQLEKAAFLVRKLLVPMDDEVNEHKQLQLRKLADYNGTLRENNWNTPGGRGFDSVQAIVCDFCGEPSHPTSDCPQKNLPGARSKLDKEYDSFLSAIGEEPSSSSSSSSKVGSSYEEFMASINQSTSQPKEQQQQAATQFPQQPFYGGFGGPPPFGAPGFPPFPPQQFANQMPPNQQQFRPPWQN